MNPATNPTTNMGIASALTTGTLRGADKRRNWSFRLAAIAALLNVAAYGQAAPAAMHAGTNHPLSAATVLKALGGQLPPSFDFATGDPCNGPWTMILPGTGDRLRLMVVRYKGIPLIHVSGTRREVNAVWSKVGPQTIRFKAGRVTNALTCGLDQASVMSTMVIDGKLQTFPVEVHRGAFPAL